jgi:hypothetical protein
MRARAVCLACLGAALLGCGGDSTTPGDGTATFTRLQSEVFATSCATTGCHVGSSVAISGNLSLAGDAFESLVNVAPTNLNAKQDGLRRVVPGWPDSSLLYLKLLSPSRSPHDYGNLMPSGGTPLSAGQVEYVLQWIAAGAPRDGSVAAPALLSDVTPQAAAPFQPLSPPAAGTGFQLRVDPFVVKADFERELFLYRPIGNTSEIYVKRFEFRMRPNSHHFVAYTFPEGVPAAIVPQLNVVRDIRRPDGSLDMNAMWPMAYHLFFGGSMQTESAYDFPPGVALRVPANMALDLNVHYANHTAAPVTGEAYLNLYTMDAASVQHVAKALNMPNLSISLPPNQRTTIERTFQVSERKTVFALTSHMHRLGEKFVITIVGGARDGEIVYESTDWEHPQLLLLNTPIVLEAGEGLKSTITWNNTTGHTVTSGLQSTDEMGIIFGYYY